MLDNVPMDSEDVLQNSVSCVLMQKRCRRRREMSIRFQKACSQRLRNVTRDRKKCQRIRSKCILFHKTCFRSSATASDSEDFSQTSCNVYTESKNVLPNVAERA